MKLGTQVAILTPVLPIELPQETATLVSITDTTFTAERTYGNFRMEGCKPGQAYVMQVVQPRRGMIDRGENSWGKINKNSMQPDLKNVEQFIIHAEDIAMDLVRQWNSDIWGIGSTPTGEVANEIVRGFAGVFVADGALPTIEELDEAHRILALSDRALAERAHSEWDQFHSPMTIHAGWKRAARRLGVTADWLYSITDQNSLPDCVYCGSKMLTPTASVCSVCHKEQSPAQQASALQNEQKSPKRAAKRRGRPPVKRPVEPTGEANA